MSNAKLVLSFLESNFYKEKAIFDKYIHQDIEVYWNSSQGFSTFNNTELFNIFSDMGKSFTSLNPIVSHNFSKGNIVATRFSYEVETLEHPESMPLAHFMGFWEINEDKITKIHLMSHKPNANN